MYTQLPRFLEENEQSLTKEEKQLLTHYLRTETFALSDEGRGTILKAPPSLHKLYAQTTKPGVCLPMSENGNQVIELERHSNCPFSTFRHPTQDTTTQNQNKK
jgi:hypothetical protein